MKTEMRHKLDYFSTSFADHSINSIFEPLACSDYILQSRNLQISCYDQVYDGQCETGKISM